MGLGALEPVGETTMSTTNTNRFNYNINYASKVCAKKKCCKRVLDVEL